MMSPIAAALHIPASDGILKNTFANYAFEHHEIAAYTSPIAMARFAGDAASAMVRVLEVPTTDRSLSPTRDGSTAGP